MIDKLILKNFKNFRHAELQLGGLSVLIGTNASGKSNLREAFRFLNGIARNYTLAEIFGGKWIEGEPVWKELRGGYREVCFHGTNVFEVTVESFPYLYSISVLIDEKLNEPMRVVRESLRKHHEDAVVFDACATQNNDAQLEDASKLSVQLGLDRQQQPLTSPLGFPANKPLLLQLFNHPETPRLIAADIEKFASELLNMRFLDLSPEAMRRPSIPGQTTLSDRGENLASVLKKICQDSASKASLLEWLTQLTPMDLADFNFLQDPAGKLILAVKEHDGNETTVNSMSEGTLRFLGLLTALFDPAQDRLYFFEEIENGIHPTRIGLLIKFIQQRLKQQTDHHFLQVITTTHSPQLVRYLDAEHRNNSSLIYRLEGDSAGQIMNLAKMPHLTEVLTESNIGDLHESGWFENVIEFESQEEGIA